MRISFDFDGTLVDEFGGISINEQQDEIQALAKRYLKEGHDVCIITKRYGPEFPTLGLGNEHLKVLNIAKRLGIQEVHFTNREMKFSTIYNLGIQMHFENCDHEIAHINTMCHQNDYKCVVVPVEDPYWRDLVY